MSDLDRLKGDPRLYGIRACYQCGLCTAVCPGVEVFEGHNPRVVVHLKSLDSELKGGYAIQRTSRFLDDVDPSACFQCYSCRNICPRGVSAGGVIKHIREANRENGKDKHLGLLRENLLAYGQSITPEIFDGADQIWGDSWREVKQRKEYKKDEPKKRYVSQGVIEELTYLVSSARKLNLKPPKIKEKGSAGRHLRNMGKIIVFNSCCAYSHYPGIARSLKYILDKIGLPHTDLQEQSCCGGFAYYANDLGLNEMILIGARNLSLMENEGNTVAIACATCFSANLAAKQFLSEEDNKNKVNDVLSEINKRVNGDLNIVRIEEILYENIDLVKDAIELDFSEFNVATHSGCHYRYFDLRAEKPDMLDELAKITGARVIDYPLKDRCCGGGFEKSFVGDIDKVRELNSKKQSDIADVGASLVILDCPGCEMTFDRNSPELSKKRPLKLGYMHILELLAAAMGADPHRVVGVQYHTAYAPLLEKLKMRSVIDRYGSRVSVLGRSVSHLCRKSQGVATG